jgi:chemotaxis signal transduction protein
MTEIDWQSVNRQLTNDRAQVAEKNSRDIQHWPELLEQRAKQLAKRTPPAQKELQPYLVFLLQTQRFALALSALKEVAPLSGCTPLPLAPPALLGIANQRGIMVSILELAILLDLPSTAQTTEGYVLYVRTHPVLGLRIDSLLDMVYLADSDIMAGSQAIYLKGLFADIQVLDFAGLNQHPLLDKISLQTHQAQEQ